MAIDTEKMKALAAELRANHEAMKSWMPTHQLESSPASKGADAIDTLLAALESSKQEADALLSTIAECRDKAHAEGYGESFLYEAIACPDDVPAFIGQTVTELRAALEAAAADKRDAERYRCLRRGQHWSVIDGIGNVLRAETIDYVVDVVVAQGREEERYKALSQRQEES
ncbi:hypothetical protein L0Z16_03415 [Burkholderia multivorans]|uniref:hypothetical protein n=1 Tax=Burkholderia multivorans TaxID=87883 RepID=UPI002018A24A|nr:hypothetical protein [Burkholderia multivorans]MCL4664445.1 hypothetical protein [Burkholderia multivorans]MCO1355839.1 hypothetical protein [Burkholderia multivorans]MCO1415977.1 hypothetical protein [Burkholderia multivorans]MCO1449920.1 hypothetical protein [Burkholderia multivorans]UQP43330.1 hypothetical protein L0Z16_03415 [Burkholderia multivorans]